MNPQTPTPNCPRCSAPLDLDAERIVCGRCGFPVTRVGRIPLLLPRPVDHVIAWRRQLGLLQLTAEQTLEQLHTQEGVSQSGAGRERARSLAGGVRDQMGEIAALLAPALGGALPPEGGTGLPRGIVEHIHFLYRDWGWPTEGGDENRTALDGITSIVGRDRPLGRTLVLGAGACRLAYDLHVSLGAAPTFVIDIDPFLFVIAEAVVRGHPVFLTETTANAQENAHLPRTWTLAAPGGPLDARAFVFLLADGLAPPFAAESFDTVVTPWFIDQVPQDLPVFLSTVRRLLKAGGRWVNQGPLLYPADAPLARRFSREELFDLSERAGLVVERWATASRPHLVSPLSGRGKIEWVLTFDARAQPPRESKTLIDL
jgi:N2227-like protein